MERIGINDICKGTTKAAITVASNKSLPKNLIHVREYAKKEQIIRGIKVEGIATANVLIKAFINTFAVAIPSTLIPLIICSFFAYSLTWMRFFGRDLLLATVIAALVVPLQMSLIPILSIYNDIGALFGVAAKSFPGIWMAHTGFGLASTTFLLWNFLKSLPNEMMEAARVDGATHYDTFIKIVVHLSIPAFASIFILQFLWVWNDLLVGLVFLDKHPSEIILTAKLKELLGSRGENWEILTTGAFISMSVPLLIFFSLQRYFIRGLVAGSVKG